MRQFSKFLVPAMICFSVSSFATQKNLACVEDVDCQNSKIEAMTEDSIFSEFNRDLYDLMFTLNKLSEKETVAEDYQAEGYAKALGRLHDLEVEASSIIKSGNVSAASIHGRKLPQIHHEIVEIRNSIKSAQAVQ